MRIVCYTLIILAAASTAAMGQPATTVVVPAVTEPNTLVNVGEIIGSLGYALLWAFAPAIAALLVGLIFNLIKGSGMALTSQRKEQFQQLIVNGIHWGADFLKQRTAGTTLTVDVKSQLVKKVLEYVSIHGQKIIKDLGVKPDSPELATAVEARVTRALNDPATPTPANVTPEEGRPKEISLIAPTKPAG